VSEKSDGLEKLREKVAAQHGFELYRRYSEKEASRQIGYDYSTLKRKRRAGIVPFVDLGGGSVGYMGYHVADIILFGVNAKSPATQDETLTGTRSCPDTPNGNSSSAIGSYGSETTAPPTTALASIGPPTGSSALALARIALTKPSASSRSGGCKPGL